MDTLEIYERLKKAQLREQAAKEIAEVFKEVTERNFATKGDIENLRLGVEKIVSQAKVEIIKWVAGRLVAQAAIVATLVKLL